MQNVDMINHVDRYKPDGGSTILKVNNLEYFDEPDYDLDNPKEFRRYIDDIKRTVRTSFEYSQLIKYLKEANGMNVCSVWNVSADDGANIEIHHTPFTLEDIVIAVFNKHKEKFEELDVYSIAEEVIYLHYIGWVGLIPLCETVHNMVHNNYIFIPMNVVRGYYNNFFNAFKDYIDPVTVELYHAYERATDKYNADQMQIFNQHKLYIDSNGSINLPGKDKAISDIKDHINNNRKPAKLIATLIR